MICKCGRGSRNRTWRDAEPYSIHILPYGVYRDRLTFTFYLCHYKQSPAYVVNDNAWIGRLRNRGLLPGRVKNIQTGCGAPPAFHSVGNGGSSPGVKRSGVEHAAGFRPAERLELHRPEY